MASETKSNEAGKKLMKTKTELELSISRIWGIVEKSRMTCEPLTKRQIEVVEG